MIKKALLIFILIFVLIFCSCAKQQSTQTLLVSLLEVSGESLEGNGIFYYSEALEGELGYFSKADQFLMYGKDNVEHNFPKIEACAMFVSSRVPSELAIFKCYSASDTDEIERMCLERADEIKVALYNTQWRDKTEGIRVIAYKRYVLFSFVENGSGVERKLKELI